MANPLLSDITDEALETGKAAGDQVATAAKKTGQQLRDEPVKVIEDVLQQTGLKPTLTPEQEAQKIKELEKKDQEKKAAELNFWRLKVGEYDTAARDAISKKTQEAIQRNAPPALGVSKKKELPPPVLAAKRKGPEMKEHKAA